MSLVATGVLLGFIIVSGALFVRSRRPVSESPSAIMMSLMDRADELENQEARAGRVNRARQSGDTDSTRRKTPFTPYGVTLKTKSQTGS